MDMVEDRVCGWFQDRGGRRWFCVQRKSEHKWRDDTIVCDSDDGWFTAANPRTFASWAWSPLPLTAPNERK
jgi:hypothetical protein